MKHSDFGSSTSHLAPRIRPTSCQLLALSLLVAGGLAACSQGEGPPDSASGANVGTELDHPATVPATLSKRLIVDANSGGQQEQQAAPVQLTQPQQSRSEETVRAHMPTSTTAEDIPKVIVDPAPAAVIAGPGALKAAGVEPVELTQRKAAASGEPESSEQRWFKQ